MGIPVACNWQSADCRGGWYGQSVIRNWHSVDCKANGDTLVVVVVAVDGLAGPLFPILCNHVVEGFRNLPGCPPVIRVYIDYGRGSYGYGKKLELGYD